MNSIDDDQGIGDLHPVLFVMQEVKKSVAAKLKKAGELIGEAEYALDEALEQNPHDTQQYVAYSEEVELEWPNKEKWIRSDNVNISKFDLSLTQLADTTHGGTADV
ncbi:hypothetical protein Tco_0718235 [Tanacetum coccineum]